MLGTEKILENDNMSENDNMLETNNMLETVKMLEMEKMLETDNNMLETLGREDCGTERVTIVKNACFKRSWQE
jgi:hypothetical protein